MQVVIDSKEFKKLLQGVEKLYDYTEKSSEYSRGFRDGHNEACEAILTAMQEFWVRSTT